MKGANKKNAPSHSLIFTAFLRMEGLNIVGGPRTPHKIRHHWVPVSIAVLRERYASFLGILLKTVTHYCEAEVV